MPLTTVKLATYTHYSSCLQIKNDENLHLHSFGAEAKLLILSVDMRRLVLISI